MSEFCGKCDFYDSIVMINLDGDRSAIEEYLKKTNIYIRGKDGREHKVDCKTEKDLAKYYPYLVSIGTFSKENRTVVLSSKCFIDSEEEEFLNFHIQDAYKYWRKCKRLKKPFVVDEYIEQGWRSDNKIDRIIAERILENGNKAKFNDLHLPMHERYRRRWFEELVRLGYEEIKAFNWCFNEFYPSDEVIEERLGRKIQM